MTLAGTKKGQKTVDEEGEESSLEGIPVNTGAKINYSRDPPYLPEKKTCGCRGAYRLIDIPQSREEKVNADKAQRFRDFRIGCLGVYRLIDIPKSREEKVNTGKE